MSGPVYASELAAKALRLLPGGSPHVGAETCCAMCGREILTGDLSEPLTLGKTFLDFGKLVPGSAHVCGWCVATAKQEVMRSLQRSCITAQGIYNINTDDSRAWFWTTPPEPPYAIVINHNTMAAFHYFWRTPVTLDNELVQMNVDNRHYCVRRARVLAALGHARTIMEASAAVSDKKRKALKSPFVMLSRQPSKGDRTHGVLATGVAALAACSAKVGESVRFLQSLTPGELIALSPMVKGTPATAVQPELQTAV